LIAKTPFPREFVHEVWQWLSLYDNSFVSIIASTEANDKPSFHPHVQGESNVIESLMQTWTSSITTEVLAKLKISLNPVDLTVQWWLRCLPNTIASSGWLWTTHPWKNNSDWLVVGSWGDHSTVSFDTKPSDHLWQQVVKKSWPEMDQWWIDRRSKEVTFHHKGIPESIQQPTADGWKKQKPSATQQNKACLSNEQLSELIDLAWQAKRHIHHHIALRWYAAPKALYFTDWVVSEHKVFPEKVVSQHKETKKILPKTMTGTVIQQGQVSGKIHVLKKNESKMQLSKVKGSILVAERLEAKDAHVVANGAPKGIITQHPITHPSLVAQIRRYGIPTISGVAQLKKAKLLLHRPNTATLKATKAGKLGFVVI
jgi:phosphohistidine swiveling domain-containing protein